MSSVHHPSLFVIIPGFGPPHIDVKVNILEKNLRHIRSYPWKCLKIRVCVYDARAISAIPDHLLRDPGIEWVLSPGIVGQFIHRFAPPAITNEFDYVLLLLDDVELMPNVDFGCILEYDNMFHFDIYSPSMTPTSKIQFEYMVFAPNSPCHLAVTSACEMFCYFMPSKSFAKYYGHLEPDNNPWLWGMDMCILKCIGLKPVIINYMNMHHHFKNECYALRPDQKPEEGYKFVMKKYNVTTEELAAQHAVLYYLIDPARLASP